MRNITIIKGRHTTRCVTPRTIPTSPLYGVFTRASARGVWHRHSFAKGNSFGTYYTREGADNAAHAVCSVHHIPATRVMVKVVGTQRRVSGEGVR